MSFGEFHNALRIMRSIDAWERPDPLTMEDMHAFMASPYDWFIKAPTAKAEAIFAVIERRQSR